MSFSLNPLPVRKAPARTGRAHRLIRGCAGRLIAAAALACIALLAADFAAAAPPEVRTPDEVRTAPGQFIVVAVANPVTGRPAAVGGTAHGYGSTTNYR